MNKMCPPVDKLCPLSFSRATNQWRFCNSRSLAYSRDGLCESPCFLDACRGSSLLKANFFSYLRTHTHTHKTSSAAILCIDRDGAWLLELHGGRLEKDLQSIQEPISQRKSLAMASSRSFKDAVLRSALQPIRSLKSARLNEESGAKLFAFAVKVAALEICRRRTRARLPLVWGCIRSLPLLQLPPLSWLQCWGPLHHFFSGLQVFSKPILFMSLATSMTDILEELKCLEEPMSHVPETCTNNAPLSDSEPTGPSTFVTTHVDWGEGCARPKESVSDELTQLKKELKEARVTLPEIIGDDELKRFLLVANNDVKKSIQLVKKNIHWRETFYFFSQYELDKWTSLVFWHGYDVQMRPLLVVRIGRAYSILKANERPRFVQAILSQVEHGVTCLLQDEDPRIAVILDCEETPALGFPVSMFKSCCARVQENYPTRLAALFVVNLRPVVRAIAQTIIQVLKPATKRKIFVEGEKHNTSIEHHISLDSMPFFLGGRCTCSICKAVTRDGVQMQLINKKEPSGAFEDVNSSFHKERSTFGSFQSIFHAIIMGFLILWAVVHLLAGYFDFYAY